MRSASARTASEEARLQAIKREDLMNLCETDHYFGYLLMRNIASDLAFKIMPLPTKLKAGLPAVAKVFDSFSDQTSYVVDPGGDHYLYHIARCSMCWDRHVDHPVCFIASGILEEALRWVSSGRTFRVDEISCIGMGDQTCSYAIYKEPIG